MCLIKPANAQSRAHPFFACLTVFIALVGSLLTVLGPLQPGWNAIANNGNGSGGTINAAAPQSVNSSSSSHSSSSQSSSIFTPPFSSNLQGSMTQTDPGGSGAVTIRFDMTLAQQAGGHYTFSCKARRRTTAASRLLRPASRSVPIAQPINMLGRSLTSMAIEFGT